MRNRSAASLLRTEVPVNELNRRDVMRAVATGAALAGGATVAQTPAVLRQRPTPRQSRRSPKPRALPGAENGLSITATAHVAMCRSWVHQVYLTIEDGPCGFVTLDVHGFTLAAAAQAARVPVFVRHWGHDAAAELGLGSFAGALLAFDGSDLGGSADQPES